MKPYRIEWKNGAAEVYGWIPVEVWKAGKRVTLYVVASDEAQALAFVDGKRLTPEKKLRAVEVSWDEFQPFEV